MEILIGAVGLVLVILVWLFPPDSLRRLLRIRPEAGRSVALPRTATSRLSEWMEKLPVVDDDTFTRERMKVLVHKAPPPRHIGASDRARLLSWLSRIDDEVLMVALAMAPMAGQGVTRAWLSANSHPLGAGRSAEELCKALLDAGVLAPSTEELHPGTYAHLDAQGNPAYDFGEMLKVLRRSLPLAEQEKIVPSRESRRVQP